MLLAGSLKMWGTFSSTDSYCPGVMISTSYSCNVFEKTSCC